MSDKRQDRCKPDIPIRPECVQLFANIRADLAINSEKTEASLKMIEDIHKAIYRNGLSNKIASQATALKILGAGIILSPAVAVAMLQFINYFTSLKR